MSAPAALLGAAAGAAKTVGAERVFAARPPGGAERWRRTNYAGREVSLIGGLAAGSGAVAGAAWTGLGRGAQPRVAAAGAIAATAGTVLGLLDDLGEDTEARTKGLRGHLGALREGRVTTGALKIAGIGAGALAAAALTTPTAGGPVRRAVDVLTGAALVAGTANLHNLFDLRPGRTLKVALLISVPLAASGGLGGARGDTGHATTASAALAAAAGGVAVTALPGDLGERTMLGDTGANGVGALVGTALAAHPSALVRHGALAAVLALTLASERVSFSRVIDSVPALRAVDALGRRA